MTKNIALCAILITCAVGIHAEEGDRGFAVVTANVKPAPLIVPGLPEGIIMYALHENPRTGMSSSVLSYPEGYREPRHYHESSGHYMYILKGRIESPMGVLTPGMFIYAPPGERHGPFDILEPSEALFITDGPPDFIVDDE